MQMGMDGTVLNYFSIHSTSSSLSLSTEFFCWTLDSQRIRSHGNRLLLLLLLFFGALAIEIVVVVAKTVQTTSDDDEMPSSNDAKSSSCFYKELRCYV